MDHAAPRAGQLGVEAGHPSEPRALDVPQNLIHNRAARLVKQIEDSALEIVDRDAPGPLGSSPRGGSSLLEALGPSYSWP